MAGNNPYNPQTDYNNWLAYEQSQAAQQKRDFESSTEGEQAKAEGKRKAAIDKAKKEQAAAAKRGTSAGGVLGGQGTGVKFDEKGKIKDWKMPAEEKREEIDKKLAEQGFDPLTDEEAKTLKKEREKEFDRRNGLVDEKGNRVEGPSVNFPISFTDGEAAGKKAQESVKQLGSFDMPKASKLGEYSKIGDAAKHEGIMPKSIWQAWKNGEFNTATDPDGKKTRNYLMLNSALTAIGNAARGFEGGLQHTGAEHKDTLWQKRQEENMARQTERENVQNDVLKQAETDTKLSDIWGSFTPEQKQGVLDAKNAFATGNLSKAEDLMRNSMGDQRYSEWLQYFENLKAQLSVNADARAQEQLRYMETMGPIGLLLDAAGKFIPGL